MNMNENAYNIQLLIKIIVIIMIIIHIKSLVYLLKQKSVENKIKARLKHNIDMKILEYIYNSTKE